MSPNLLKAIAREARQLVGIERTPKQIETWCQVNLVYPEKTLREALKHRNIMETLAHQMRIAYLDKSPPSSEWYEGK